MKNIKSKNILKTNSIVKFPIQIVFFISVSPGPHFVLTQTLKQSGVPDSLKLWRDQISLGGLKLLKTQCPGSHMSHQNSFPIIFGNLEFREILMSFGISEGNLVIFEKSP